jgi:hypothetical protein
VPMAVSDKCGQLPLYTPAVSTHFASLERRDEKGPDRTVSLLPGPCSLLVDVTTLDEFFTSDRKPPHFLKIDVEGHELSVLEGGRRTLEMHHPKILVECEARHRGDGDVRPVFNLLESLGYTGSFLCHGSRRPLAEFDPAVHQRLNSNTYQLPAGYANNFAFELGK